MKKTLSTLLALMLLLTLSTAAFADESAVIGCDLYEHTPDSGMFLPGVLYKVPLYNGSTPLDDEVYEYFKISAAVSEVEAYVEERDGTGSTKTMTTTSSTRKYVSVCDIVKEADGLYYLHFMGNPANAYKYSASVTISLRSVERKPADRDNINMYEDLITVEVGYSGNVEYCSDEECYLGDDVAWVEVIDEDQKEIKFEFSDLATFDVKLGKSRYFNLFHISDENEAVVKANPGAALTFLNFVAAPSFVSDGTFWMHAPGAKYLYSIDSANKLTLLSSFRGGDNIGTTTRKLVSFVASDIPLQAAYIAAGAAQPATPTAPAAGITATGSSGSSTQVIYPITPSAGKAVPVTGVN